MKLIKPSFEIIEQKPRDIVIPSDMEIGPKMARQELIDTVYRQIEIAGRTCYKSEDKITLDSAAKFVERMVKSGHGAMLEHGTVYLKNENSCDDELKKYLDNKYSTYKSVYAGKRKCQDDTDYYYSEYVTTNFRVLVENNWLNDLKYICEPTEHHEKRITVRFVCDRGVSHEFVRHRVFSFAQESTRYCNYSKDKFGNECTFIIPSWLNYEEQQFVSKNDFSCSIRTDLSEHEYFIDLLLESERTYNYLTQYCDWKPQQARAILPNSLKTELVMTGTIEQWEGFFKLRDAGSAHPQAYELAHPLHEEFIKRGWTKNN